MSGIAQTDFESPDSREEPYYFHLLRQLRNRYCDYIQRRKGSEVSFLPACPNATTYKI